MSQDIERSERIRAAFDLILRTGRLHHRTIDKIFGDTGLPRSQRKILLHLNHSADVPSQREIAQHFDVSPACVARMLKSMAQEGFITRTGDEDDLRRNQVRITEKGMQTVANTRSAFDDIDARMFSGLSDEEVLQLTGLLQRLHDNLQICAAELDQDKAHEKKGSAPT